MAASKHIIPLHVILSKEHGDCSDCRSRLEKELATRIACDEVHLTAEGEQGICIHFNPDAISVAELEKAAIAAGAQLAKQYAHASLHLHGMDCADCVNIIEHLLSHLTGIFSARVSYVAEQLVVEYDPEKITLDDIRKKLKRAGYEADEADHAHNHFEELKEIGMSLAAGFSLLLSYFFQANAPILAVILLIAAFVGAGYFTLRHSIETLLQKRLDIDVLMIIAAFGAVLIGAWYEGGLLLFLFSLGHALEHRAMDKARDAVTALKKLAPQSARLSKGDEITIVNIADVAVGDTVIVHPFERIPCDGNIINGQSAVNEAAITGESLPAEKTPGDDVFAGTLNGEGLLTITVTKLSSDNLINRMVQLVLAASTQKSPTQRLTERFSFYFVPVVLLITTLLTVIPLIFFSETFTQAFYRAMAFLVAASPCALAIGTPSAILSGIARAARHGVLIKGGLHLENLASLNAIAFDKTGTLTLGRPSVAGIHALKGDETSLLSIAAAVEMGSHHPLANAIVEEAKTRNLTLPATENLTVIPGKGLSAIIAGKKISLGNERFFNSLPESLTALNQREESKGYTTVIIQENEEFIGIISLADTVRPESKAVVEAVHAAGISHTALLTGDNPETARSIAKQVGIDAIFASLSPEQKVESIKTISSSHGATAMIGDGVNDAPALAQATIGIAMGGAGSPAALEAADIALMDNDLRKLPFAILLSHATKKIIKQNLTLALSVVGLLALATVSDQVGIGFAVAIHEGSSLIVVINSLRLLRQRLPLLASSS